MAVLTELGHEYPCSTQGVFVDPNDVAATMGPGDIVEGWLTADQDLNYATGKRYGNTTRAFPHRRSDGMMFDPRRKLVWGTDTNSQVYVLRLERDKANLQPLR